MDKVKNIAAKVLSIWAGIGVAILALGSTGIIPDTILQLFSAEGSAAFEAVVNTVVQGIGAVLTFAQFVRALFVAKPEVEAPDVGIKTISNKEVREFKFNPFKIV